MTSRSRVGFTLLEVIVALALTAVAVAIAASALRAATVARERVAEHAAHEGALLRFRSQLTEMLRHAPSAEIVNEPLLQVLTDDVGQQSLIFLSTGVREPFGTGAIWRVSLSQRGDSVLLDAVPLRATSRRADDTRVHTTVHSAGVMRAEVLERAGGLNGPQWRRDWPLTRARPAALALSFGANTEPLLVALDPLPVGGVPR